MPLFHVLKSLAKLNIAREAAAQDGPNQNEGSGKDGFMVSLSR